MDTHTDGHRHTWCHLAIRKQVDDERIVVFFDGTDSVWGGCNDFVERYLRLERATGGQ